MADWLKVIILGIVEGITEYLPISSTGHLIIAEEFFPLPDNIDGIFEIFIQIGAVFAVLFYYREPLWQQVRSVQQESVQRLWLGVAVAFMPAAAIGLLLSEFLAMIFNPVVVALALIAGGILFLVVERAGFGETAADVTGVAQSDEAVAQESAADVQITLRQALIIGCWQVLALIPGMSRSGMSIIGGMMSGLDRQTATQFSFYLAIPTLGAATVYTLIRNLGQIDASGLGLLLLGAIVSAVVSWVSIGWLLRYVSSNNFIPFGYYRIVVGVIILVVTQLL